MNNLSSDTLISGKVIASTMQTISLLGEIGKKILNSAGIFEIDHEQWYSHKLRIQLFDEIYYRFGSEALFLIGLKNFLYFADLNKSAQKIGEKYQYSITIDNSQASAQEALENFLESFIGMSSETLRAATRGQHDFYGIKVRKISPTNFDIKVSAAIGEKHEAFFRSVLTAGFSLFLLNEWKFNLTLKSTIYQPLFHMTTYEYEVHFQRHKSNKNSAELLSDLQINAGDALLKQVVMDSDRSLMKLNAAHKVVVGSVNYASRLQRGQLPRQIRIDNRFSSFNSIWEPRDTIGGDLYWLSSSQQSGPFVLAVADCTGHGVPGAMLSLLVSNSLERIYANGTQQDPATALLSLDHYVRTGLNQDTAESESDDGCDAAVLRIDLNKSTIEFAGAKLGLFQVTAQGVLTRHIGSRCSLGYQDPIVDKDKPVVQIIHYQAGDTFAIVTDGVTDQIGGANGKTSYGYRRLEAILKAHCLASTEDIIQAITRDFAAWQGANTRRDDVTAVVFRF